MESRDPNFVSHPNPKTTDQLDLVPNEKVNDIDCFVLNVTPGVQAVIDWVISQAQPYGPQFDVMYGGGTPVVRPDAYQSGSVKLWIGQTSYLPVKVEFNADFQSNVGGGPISITATPYIPTANPVDASFRGELDFSNYNQPVSVQLPPEALTAIGH